MADRDASPLDVTGRVRPALAGFEPYDPAFTPCRINLSANENTHPLPASVTEAMRAAAVSCALNRYPDPMANDLRDLLAAWHGVERGNVMVGNGGDELLFNLLFTFGGPGWRGTIARIGAKAARALMDETGCAAEELRAYVGPHICAGDYEVSSELMERFVGEFGPAVDAGERHLDLGLAVRAALVETGVPEGSIASCDDSTASNVGRFFSYRAEEGRCGRHAALAVLGSDAREAWRPAPLG